MSTLCQDSLTCPFFGFSALFALYQHSCQVSIQPCVGMIQPFACMIAYIQPYYVSECIDIGFDIQTLLCEQHFQITLLQPFDLPKYLSFNPVAG